MTSQEFVYTFGLLCATAASFLVGHDNGFALFFSLAAIGSFIRGGKVL